MGISIWTLAVMGKLLRSRMVVDGVECKVRPPAARWLPAPPAQVDLIALDHHEIILHTHGLKNIKSIID